jgi:hypothetical protein
MKFDYKDNWLDHEADKDAAQERLIDHADFLRDEQKDRAWEATLERDAGPWDRIDAFSLAKEAEFYATLRDKEEIASKTAQDALTSVSSTDTHHHDQDAPQRPPNAKKSQL